MVNGGAAGLENPSAGAGGRIAPGTITHDSFQPVLGYRTGPNPRSLALADLDRDGKLDIVVANEDSVSVLLGTAELFATPVAYPTNAQTGWVALGDLNADGVLDITVTNMQSSSLQVLPGLGDGTFGTIAEAKGGQSLFSLVLGDVDNDGKLDAVTSPGGDAAPGDTAPSTGYFASVFLGDGSGKFAEPTYFAEGGACLSVALGDVNADGNLDLARVNRETNTVSVFLGSGAGSFSLDDDYATGQAPLFVTFADLNEDGQLDLLTADSASDQLSVLLASGAGKFAPRVGYATGTTPDHVAVADLNGDQHLDLIAANVYAGSVSLFQGVGDGTFAPSVDFSTAATNFDQPFPQVSAVGDFNRDGAPDFAVVNSHSNGVLIFLAVRSP